MNKNIDMRHFKAVVKSKGITFSELSEMTGIRITGLSWMSTGRTLPKTDVLAKICSILKCYPSEIVTFSGYEMNDKYFGAKKPMALPDEAAGEVTYKPLWALIADYTYNISGKTANDLFDQIEPPRRQKGVAGPSKETIQKSLTVRYGEGYKSKRTSRTDYSKGLNAITRVKLRNDRPLTLGIIYEICKKLGCSIDWVMSYK